MNPILPKAELHCHLEGTISPDMVRKLAHQHQMPIPDGLFRDEQHFAWKDFPDFLHAYDLASSVIKTAADYEAVTYDYLMRSAKEGAIYTEVMSSPDHAAFNGMSYTEHLHGVIQGIKRAQTDSGIIARIIITCVRHLGIEKSIAVAKAMLAHPHPFVVGFGMGGNENYLTPQDFLPAFALVAEHGYPCTVHAGEVCGPHSVWDALSLPVTRIGHGVRSIDDDKLLQTLVKKNLCLEVCPGSNLALRLYPNYAEHPLLKLRDHGVKVCISSDDPPFFNTSIGTEYHNAQQHFQLSDAALLSLTRQSIESAFCDEHTKKQLFTRLDQYSI